MEKICVFCGERPESKSLEHVLPRWLIELTGDPKRIAFLGNKVLINGQGEKRFFSFDAFKFPACESCNQSFAGLEEKTQTVVKKAINEEPISEIEFSLLFDWFDKIRVGLWLGYRYLNNDSMGISPHYYINGRIGQHDRMLLIMKADDPKKGLTFFGCETPAFTITPSCFSLRINNFCFLNISYPNLFCRRIGFPYPRVTYMLEDEKMECYFVEGKNRIMPPLLRKFFSLKGTELYQPMFLGNIHSGDDDSITKLYETQYVHDNCISFEKGIGKIFVNNSSKINLYSGQWVPNHNYPLKALLFQMQIVTLEWQLYLDKLRPSLELMSKTKRLTLEKKLNLSQQYNKIVIEALRKRESRLDLKIF